MKQINFSHKSWHYRLAAVYGNLENSRNYSIHRNQYVGDSCEYIWEAFKGFLICLLITAGALVVLVPFVDLFAGIAVMLITGSKVELNEVAGVAIGVLIGISALGIFVAGWHCLKKLYYNVKMVLSKNSSNSYDEPSQPSFTAVAYEKFKSKVCVKVVVKKEIEINE